MGSTLGLFVIEGRKFLPKKGNYYGKVLDLESSLVLHIHIFQGANTFNNFVINYLFLITLFF